MYYFELLLFLLCTNCILMIFLNIIFAVYVLCKQGNDSQKAVQLLIDKGFCKNLDNLLFNDDPSCVRDSTLDTSAGGKLNVTFKDIDGGLQAWAKHIDKDFPVY